MCYDAFITHDTLQHIYDTFYFYLPIRSSSIISYKKVFYNPVAFSFYTMRKCRKMVASIDKQTRRRARLSVSRASPNPFYHRQKIVLTHGFTGFFTLFTLLKYTRKDVEILGYIKVYFTEQ
jgi:hypothetical protein